MEDELNKKLGKLREDYIKASNKVMVLSNHRYNDLLGTMRLYVKTLEAQLKWYVEFCDKVEKELDESRKKGA